MHSLRERSVSYRHRMLCSQTLIGNTCHSLDRTLEPISTPRTPSGPQGTLPETPDKPSATAERPCRPPRDHPEKPYKPPSPLSPGSPEILLSSTLNATREHLQKSMPRHRDMHHKLSPMPQPRNPGYMYKKKKTKLYIYIDINIKEIVRALRVHPKF